VASARLCEPLQSRRGCGGARLTEEAAVAAGSRREVLERLVQQNTPFHWTRRRAAVARSPRASASTKRSSATRTRIRRNANRFPQNLEPGQEPKYVAEVWWQLGNYHFDQIDIGGGPYELNRAMSAYEHSMKYKRPPLYGVALYKRAWTYFQAAALPHRRRVVRQSLALRRRGRSTHGDPGPISDRRRTRTSPDL